MLDVTVDQRQAAPPQLGSKHHPGAQGRERGGDKALCSLNPPAGDVPPPQGRVLMKTATSAAPTSKTGSGHQTGAEA